MQTFDWNAVREELMREYKRKPFAEGIESADFLIRWRSLRRFYEMASDQISAAGRCEWGIDPYEVDWVSIFTPIESALWHDIRAAGAVLYPQYPVGRYFVDFANPVAMVAVECDGAAWHQDKAKDAKRDAELADMGWVVYRISGRDCKQDFDEETMERSAARKLIDFICEQHEITRK